MDSLVRSFVVVFPFVLPRRRRFAVLRSSGQKGNKALGRSALVARSCGDMAPSRQGANAAGLWEAYRSDTQPSHDLSNIHPDRPKQQVYTETEDRILCAG
jgi:hypothetical protein